ncbi:MAG: hypothetical protein LBM04_08395 [Opitutaceae bacterium]|nr:hypothetical protein [Opitutaceae bacterium]
MLRQLETDQTPRLLNGLRQALEGLDGQPQAHLQRTIGYFENNISRLHYRGARECNEPVGSGAIESTCRQYQCRFKRPGQFWTKSGDEALLALDCFWRNHRWHLLFPHSINPLSPPYLSRN